MTHTLCRRDFIKTAGLALSAGLLPAGPAVQAAEATRWPVGCRDLHLRVAGQPDSWSCMKALGAECTEVAVGLDLACPSLFHPQRKYTLATADGIRALKDDLAANGSTVSAFLMSNRLEERLDQELACARGVLKAAQQLGVQAVRIDVWPHKLDEERFLPFAIEACKRLCELAEGTSVRFGIENHGPTTNNPAFLAKLFAGVGSEKLGLTLDFGNFYWWGHPLRELYQVFEQVAPRVVHTHCKSIRFPEDKRNVRREMGWGYERYNCPIYEGDIDYKRALGILRQAGYHGDLCVEDEALGKFPENQRAEVIRREIALLKGLRLSAA